jgi:hypothetical protein
MSRHRDQTPIVRLIDRFESRRWQRDFSQTRTRREYLIFRYLKRPDRVDRVAVNHL